MYTLRIIEETRTDESKPFEQVTENFSLGNSYTILRKDSTTEFNRRLDEMFPGEDRVKIRLILIPESGHEFFIMEETPLERFDYFIMTDSGKTFERL
ncbi:MAG: hypothetical protein WC222_11425 [Parachlamydiales bacterium]|jgi:hypothetical protein